MRVLLAFDKFKDALTAPVACGIAARVIAHTHPNWFVESSPLADGGEGFASILTAAIGGEWHHANVSGPRGAPCRAGFGIVDTSRLSPAALSRLALNPSPHARLAVIELASASGLQTLPPADRDVWQTDTTGTGQLINAAIALGADAILLGVGGSATHDLGLGALTALGWGGLTPNGNSLPRLNPAAWPNLAQLIPSPRPLPPIRIACDVSNPLLGPRGAAAVFAPQKGLQPADFDRLEAETTRVATLLDQAAQNSGHENLPGAGAAGGIAFGFVTAADARLVPGFDLVEDWLDLAPKIAAADLIITGEGRFDRTSLEGKGPGSLTRRALAAGKSVWVLAGATDLAAPPTGCEITAITPPHTPLPEALASAGSNLERTLLARLAAFDSRPT